MAPKHYDQLRSDYGTEEWVEHDEFNSLVRILDTQVVGALEGVGEGVIEGGVVSAGSGLSVYVTQLAAVVNTEVGLCFIATDSQSQVSDLPANSTLYLYAQTYIVEGGGEADSRESGTVVFDTNNTGGEVSGATLLAKIVTVSASVGSVTDLRTFIPAIATQQSAQDVEDAIEAIRTAIGAQYFTSSPPSRSLDARVDDLEAAEDGGGGEAGPVYWGGLDKAAGDATSVDQAIQAAIADIEVDGGGDGIVAVPEPPWDVDAVNQAKAALDVIENLRATHAEHYVDTVAVVWGIWGDGSSGTPNFIDEENSTWLPA